MSTPPIPPEPAAAAANANAASPDSSGAGASAAAPWSAAQKIAFRFAASFLFLIVFPFPFSSAPGSIYTFTRYDHAEFRIAEWVGAHVLHVAPTPKFMHDFALADANAGYIQLLLIFVVSIFATILWSIFDRRRTDYRALHEYLRVYFRYALAFNMLAYGWDKVLALQFSWSLPEPQRLAEPLGSYSPFALMWTFMGYSKPYTIFAGLGEVAGGMLLFFRRTTTLGAIIVAFVMANVVMMNFSYGVPVKIFSSTLLLLAIFLIAPDAQRLLNFFVFNRAAAPAPESSPVHTAWLLRARPYIAAGLLIFATYWFSGPFLNRNRERASQPKSPLYGLYQVETYTQNGKSLLDGDKAWRKAIFEAPDDVSVLTNDDSQLFFDTKYDSGRSEITIFDDLPNGPERQLTYTWRDPEHLDLRGTRGSEPVEIELRKIDIAKTTLLSRGFHWSENGGFYR